MAPRKVLVFGVTGVQGGSVARSLIEDGPDAFDVWGVTRSKSSSKAKAMEKLGVKLIEANLDEPSTYEPTLKGCDNVFINANFWDYYDGTNPDVAAEREVVQNRGVIDAAQRQQVPHVTFSSLPDLGPQFPVPHCDSKVVIEKYLAAKQIPHTIVIAAWYFSNIFLFKTDTQGGKSVLHFPMPDEAPMVGFDSTQIGLWVRLAMRDPVPWNGKTIRCLGDHLTPPQMAAVLSDVTGAKVESAHLGETEFYSAEYRKSMPEELWINYKAILAGDLPHDAQGSLDLVAPGGHDFKAWAKANVEQLKKQFS